MDKNLKLFFIGALTSKPYAFKARSWELKSVASIDLFDSLGSNLNIEVKGKDIMRIQSRINDTINEEWITDKVRFSYDSNNFNRLDTVFVKNNFINKKNYSKFLATNLNFSFLVIKLNILFGKFLNKFGDYKLNINGFIGDQVSGEAIILFKILLNKLGSSNIFFDEHKKSLKNSDFIYNYNLNSTINLIDKSDRCLLIGTDPRLESPILNLRLRKNFLRNGLVIASFGFMLNPLYNIYNLGNSPKELLLFIEGRHKFSMEFINSKFPLIFFSSSLFNRKDGSLIYDLLKSLINYIPNLIQEDVFGLNCLTLNSNEGTLNEISLLNNFNSNLFKSQGKVYNIFFNIGSPTNYLKESKNSFSIYFGAYGNINLQNFDLMIPISGLYEFNGLYINNEGFCQESLFVTNNFEKVTNEFNILLGLLKYLNIFDLKIKNFNSFLNNNYSYSFSKKDFRSLKKSLSFYLFNNNFNNINYGFINKKIFNNIIENFYMTNSVLKNSNIMGKCSQEILNKKNLNYKKKFN